MRFGFIGNSHTLRSRIGDGQRTVNLYPEIVESGNGKSPVILYGTPGLSVFAALANGPVRAIFRSDEGGGRLIAVGGNTVYDVTVAGGSTSLGIVLNDGNPASIAFNGTEYMIVSGGRGYILEGTTLTEITDADFAHATMVTFVDGYFVILEPESQRIWISGLYDGTSWNALDFGTAEGWPDRVGAIFNDYAELWLLGGETTEVFYNSGNLDFPFERIQGAIIEHGIAAPWSVAKLAEGLMWLSRNQRGHGIVVRARGFQPDRVSTHAVEFAIQNYSRIDDAEAFSYQEEGHDFYVLSFPTADATWVYDASSGLWHERGYWNTVLGRYQRIRQRCHVIAYGRHLVGDRDNGNIYEQSLDTYTDNGDAIRRLRRTPDISNENKFLFHRSLIIDMEVGVGLQTGQGSDPNCIVRFSDDGGFVWSNWITRSIGQVGQYRHRVRISRLGRSRRRRYDFVITDPVKVAIVDGYVEIDLGGER